MVSRGYGELTLSVELKSMPTSSGTAFIFETEECPDQDPFAETIGRGSQDAANDDISPTSCNYTGSKYTAEFVKRHLAQCQAKHEKCRKARPETPWYPTRLVEVLPECQGVRVIETSDSRPAGPYAALSHCWGKSNMLRLVKASLGPMKDHIALSELPRTFRHAVQFAQDIGINFVWIDSLCIIQDSPADWDKESRTMFSVYKNAECNIAATHSSNSDGGLFATRDLAVLSSGSLVVENNVPGLNGRRVCANPHRFFKKSFDREIGGSPLVSRGWVFQERAISPRVVHFGSTQVFWDCNELLESDVVPGLRIDLSYCNDSMDLYSRLGSAVPRHVALPVPRVIRTIDEALEAWETVATRYSSLAFTFMKDKSVAILGVADAMCDAFATAPAEIGAAIGNIEVHSSPNLGYCAGMWLQDIQRQMTWAAYGKGQRRNPHAPSWSWLSLDGYVEWRWWKGGEGEELESKVNLATLQPFNGHMVKDSLPSARETDYLHIWCNLHAIKHFPSAHVRSALNRPHGYLYTDLARNEYTITTKGIGLPLATATFDCEYECDGSSDEGKQLYFLPLIQNGHKKYMEGRISGLVVRPVDGGRPGEYIRRGCAVVQVQRTGHLQAKEPSDWQLRNTLRKLRLVKKSPLNVDFSYETYDENTDRHLIKLL
ncbi:hypothetical protein Daus18300_013439 [Diaporthe australafricana]|uniref:Heterokaryon incompatibility domain-containing protein n=1 Tax=Diaporthe australafricana TaxID=127596 RepID=A0ABR3VZ24_9PEZI